MTMFRLVTSNRMESLADELAAILRTPLQSPLETEAVIVQSRGMERWVSMALAERHGICANIRFPFPNAFIGEVFQAAFPGIPMASPFDPPVMTWKIMKILPSLLAGPGFEQLRTYLDETEPPLKRFQLSERIADLFDQYLLFRPEMILNWEKGRGNHWQATLWRGIIKGNEKKHRAVLGKTLMERLLHKTARFDHLPERISVFGISTLPRFHMQVLAALALRTQVHLFIMNPCREYWSHITSDREMERLINHKQTKAPRPEDLHLEKGNPILAAMGKLGGEFFDLMQEFEPEEIAVFENPGESNLLSALQTDILNLVERGRDDETTSMVPENDDSIQIHSCHGPMREVEVLKDHLLHMFEKEPDLTPKDILVMTPDIEAYAPYIRAVFDVPAHDPTRIPFSIADQSIKAEGSIIEPFLAVLKLADSRFSVFEVLSVLESRPVLQRFALEETDLDLIRTWAVETRIRWGRDSDHRASLGLPAYEENTWQAGLDRLLLGYAMAGNAEQMFMDILPFDNLEGSDTLVLGRFLEFMRQLFCFVNHLAQPKTPTQWAQLLNELLEAIFLQDESTAVEIRLLHGAIYQLAEEANRSGFDEKIDLYVLRYYLEQRLKKEGFGFGFMTGAVTFCAMLPMRSIPFKVICLMGLNHDAYPRQSKTLGFDLMVKEPRKGDRSRRNDDRYLFLEAVLSARKILYLSYVGRNFRDNTLLSPSVLVSELTDYVSQGYRLANKNIVEHITTQHRLQPFSPDYFRPHTKLFSYSREYLDTARRRITPRQKPGRFISRGLPQPAAEWRRIPVDDLCRFFENPARFLLQKRLGIFLDPGPETVHDTETFHLSGLDHYHLARELLHKKLEGDPLETHFPAIRASGRLPHGAVGTVDYENIRQAVTDFYDKITPYIQEKPLDTLDVDLNIAGFHLTGRMHGIHTLGMFRFRYASIKAKDLLTGWIHHLLLNITAPAAYPRRTIIAGTDEGRAVRTYVSVHNPREILAALLQIYWYGLTRPLHFFPETARTYAQGILEGQKPPEQALAKARTVWEGNNYQRGDGEDIYFRHCFERQDPLDADFEKLSLEIFGPLMATQEKG